MKRINLLVIDNLFTANPQILSDDKIKDYLGLQELKKQESETLHRLCLALKIYVPYHHIFENYYLNYEIPQIEKEFDLLRIGSDSIINIELKSEKVDDEAILKQLKRNYYYLSFLQKKIYCYSFVTDGEINILYYYDEENKNILQINITQLLNTLSTIKDADEDNIDSLFVPSNYLISPFNTTEQFINNEYFLTKHQEQIKDEIIKKIVQNDKNKIFSISGAAGTGKTLLTYDIAKYLRNSGKKVTIIHCAQANSGIYKLQSIYGWSIITISNYNSLNTSASEILIFDESQRISKYQLDLILNENSQKYILFSHDVNQKLNKSNQSEAVVSHIESIAGQSNNHKLKNKIRHNKNLASFVQKFYDLSKVKPDDLSKNIYDDISFYFTKDIEDAKRYIEYLKNLGWEHIYLSNSLRTPDPLDYVRFSSNNSSHQAIGQEYDNVVIAINEHFYYTDALKLSYRASYYYNPLETLFQAITRTRKKLTLVIIDNEAVYKECIRIVNGEV